MVQAWAYNDDGADPQSPHKHDPVQWVDLEELRKRTGVLYWKLDCDNYEKEGKLAKIREERGYSSFDIVEVRPEKLPNYEETLKIFFVEHIHSDEEIRFVLDGSGYFDIRDSSDQWIRIETVKGDLIVLPAGLYHRFTVDSQNYIKAMRLFTDKPNWVAINRPADDHPARKNYLKTIG